MGRRIRKRRVCHARVHSNPFKFETCHVFKFKDWLFIASHLQFHVSHGGADVVIGVAVIQAGVGLGQVVDHKSGLPLLVFDFITTLPCLWYNILLKQCMIRKRQIP